VNKVTSRPASGRPYTSLMIAHGRTIGAGLRSPLNLPAGLTWLALALFPLLTLGGHTPLGSRFVVGLTAQLAFALLFLLRAVWEGRPRTAAWTRYAVLLQAVAALIAVWGLKDNVQGILLIIVAGQMPTQSARRWSICALGIIDAVYLALLLQLYPSLKSIQYFITSLAFQIFAALVTTYAYRAHSAHAEVSRINAELIATRRLLEETTRNDERLRLSRELHDVLGHKLTALKLQLALRAQADGVDDPVIRQCERLADELLTDVRGVVSCMRDSEGIDLHGALRALDPGLPQPRIVFELANVHIVDIRQAETILRCAQEGLTNTLRHSGAAQVRIVLTDGPDNLVLAVEDDGVGNKSGATPGNGLRGLQERLRQLGGQLLTENREPHGWVLRAIVPHATQDVA
jgi:signal transduction histidine kinase